MAVKEKTASAETEKKELVNSTTGEVVSLEEAYDGYADDIGAGFEGQTQDDVGIPFLVLMQPLSPEVSAEGSEVKGGMWVNRGTGQVYPTGVNFIPAHTKHVWRMWSSKDPSGSAPLADYATDSDIIQRVRAEQPFGDYSNPDNPEQPISETFEIFGLVINDDESFMPAVVTFSSTHIRAYRDFMLRARSLIITLPNGRKINPPLFSHVYTLRSKRVDKKPHMWYVPEVGFRDPSGAEKSRLLPIDDLYQAARQLHITVMEGTVKTATPARADGAGEPPLQRASTDQEPAPY